MSWSSRVWSWSLLLLCCGVSAGAQVPWSVALEAKDYARCDVMDPAGNGARPAAETILPRVRAENTLRGQGWYEWDVTVPRDGWYELLLTGGGELTDHEVFIDRLALYGGFKNKITNCWLTAGPHRVRLQRLTWTGLAAIKGLTLRASGPALAQTLRVAVASDRLAFRAGETLRLDVETGGRAAATTLTIRVKNVREDAVTQTLQVALPASPGFAQVPVAIPCRGEGVFYLSFAEGDTPIPPADVREIQFVVVNTRPGPRVKDAPLKKTLLKEIDCAAPPPAQGFYCGGGETRVVQAPFGRYRESGDTGYLQNLSDPSFFAYDLNVPQAQRPYLIEVDYPDDALRTFCIGLEEREMIMYPPAGGVDSGGCYRLSNRMHTQRFLHWPRGTEQRVLLYNAQTGRRAAAAKIRLYRIDGGLPALDVPRAGGRTFGFWLEEGDRWTSFHGAPDKTLAGHLVSMERYAESAAYMGANVLSPTLAIYQNTLFPSSFYPGYFRPTGGPRDPLPLDLTRLLLLACEKYGVRLLPDFHPTWNGYKRRFYDDRPYEALPDPKPHLLVSKDGTTGASNHQPYFNPLYPANRAWYAGMLGEFAARYADSPALGGVSLRLMSWVWESHNALPSLNWGYEDDTVHAFSKETGIAVPVPAEDPERFQKRYAWLLANAREAWTSWRCRQIAGLYAEINGQLRKARPDLALVAPLHGGGLDLNYLRGKVYEEKLQREGFRSVFRESGLDPAQLAAAGVTFMNGMIYYGRRHHTSYDEQAMRDYLLNPASLTACGSGAFLFGNSYFEANTAVVPEKFGLAGVKPTGFVGVVNPAGRHYLERYALALAESDASYILDGGEGYVLGQIQYLRPFLAEYRKLPDARFTPRQDARDPAAVWELTRPTEGYWYAVNRERYAVTLDLTFTGSGKLFRLGTGAAVLPKEGKLRITLQPYELQAFRALGTLAIASVVTHVPEEERALVASQVQWLGQFAQRVTQEDTGDFSEVQRIRLARFAREADEALGRGAYWRARTLIEHHVLLEMYEQAMRYPPAFRDEKAPVIPPTALRPARLLKYADGGAAPVTIEPSETVAPLWTGDQVVATTAPETQLTLEIPIANRYRIVLGHAAGGAYGPLRVTVGAVALGTAAGTRATPHAAATGFPGRCSLPQGESILTLTRTAGSKTALSFLDVTPIYRDLVRKDWSIIGPFPSLNAYKSPGDGLEKVYPPEERRDFAAAIPLEGGGTARWETPAGEGDYIDFFERYRLFSSGICYAVTYIHAPTARRARIACGFDYWAKVWLNGALAQDYSTRGYAPAKGQFTFDVELKEGWNELLVKVHSGSAGNGFWLALSDPGDLRVSARPPE